MKGRRVLKGDFIRHTAWDADALPEVFIAIYRAEIFTLSEHGADRYTLNDTGWTHADGYPIDWSRS